MKRASFWLLMYRLIHKTLSVITSESKNIEHTVPQINYVLIVEEKKLKKKPHNFLNDTHSQRTEKKKVDLRGRPELVYISRHRELSRQDLQVQPSPSQTTEKPSQSSPSIPFF